MNDQEFGYTRDRIINTLGGAEWLRWWDAARKRVLANELHYLAQINEAAEPVEPLRNYVANLKSEVAEEFDQCGVT